MYFSKTTEYVIRVLTYLCRYPLKPHSVAFLHKELQMPYKYLTKLMTKLQKRGFVNATKGCNGGFTLAMEPQSIYLQDILESVEESLESQRCILGFEMCDAKHPCSLHNRWLKPKGAIDEMLETTSLASLVNDKVNKL